MDCKHTNKALLAVQVLYNATGDLTDMDYEVEGAETLPATMHDMSMLEVQDAWARFW